MPHREDVSSRLGTRIRRAREERGISLRQLAKAVGISSPYLSEIERGWIETPSADVLEKIALELSLSAPQLFSLSSSVAPEVLRASQKHPDDFVVVARAFARLNRREAELVSSNFNAWVEGVLKKSG